MKPSLFPTLSEVTMSNAARFTLLRTVAPVFAAALAACDAQVGDDYVGEPLALLEGTISVADSAEVPGDAIAMVVWHVWQEGDGASRTAPVAIDGEFPASFELAIYEPPPAVTQFDLGEEEASLAGVHLATGYVTVMPSADVAGDLSDVLDAALGIETEYLLVWADGEVPSGFLRFTDAIQPGCRHPRARRCAPGGWPRHDDRRPRRPKARARAAEGHLLERAGGAGFGGPVRGRGVLRSSMKATPLAPPSRPETGAVCGRTARIVLALGLPACQLPVEGWWEGEIGDGPRTLRLEQTGSALEGELCSPQACDDVRGQTDENRVELLFGCSTCAFPRGRLELELVDDALEGTASTEDCSCDPEDSSCACSARAIFRACDGPC
jgi:hypothetical protein